MKYFFKIVLLLVTVIYFFISINPARAQDETYFLTPSEEKIAWDQWHADLANYISQKVYMVNGYMWLFQFQVDNHKRISNIGILSWKQEDKGEDEFPAHLYSDWCADNLNDDEMLFVHFSLEKDVDESSAKRIKIRKTKDGKSIVKLYKNIKMLNGNPILEFPKGTQRKSVEFSQMNVAADTSHWYTDSDFDDVESIQY